MTTTTLYASEVVRDNGSKEDLVAEDRRTAVWLLSKGPGAELDFLGDAMHRLTEEEAKALVGASRYERS